MFKRHQIRDHLPFHDSAKVVERGTFSLTAHWKRRCFMLRVFGQEPAGRSLMIATKIVSLCLGGAGLARVLLLLAALLLRSHALRHLIPAAIHVVVFPP